MFNTKARVEKSDFGAACGGYEFEWEIDRELKTKPTEPSNFVAALGHLENGPFVPPGPESQQ